MFIPRSDKKIGRRYYKLTQDVRNPMGDSRVKNDLARVKYWTEEHLFFYQEEDTGRLTPAGEPIVDRFFIVQDRGCRVGSFGEDSEQWKAVLPHLVEAELSVRDWMRERGLGLEGCFSVLCVLIEEGKVSADDVMAVVQRFHTEGLRNL